MTGVQPKLSQGGSGGSEVQIMIGAARDLCQIGGPVTNNQGGLMLTPIL